MTFLRLTPGHTLAFVAALALLLFAGLDWYTTAQGAEARRIERLQAPVGDEVQTPQSQTVAEAARRSAETYERNAWQADEPLEWLVLAGLLIASWSAIIAAFVRATGRQEPGWLMRSAGWGAVLTLLLIGLEVASASAGDRFALGLVLGVGALLLIVMGALLYRNHVVTEV